MLKNMDIKSALVILKSYNYSDIYKNDDTLIRQKISTGDITESLLESYTKAYGTIKAVPILLNGNSPKRMQGETFEINPTPKETVSGLGSISHSQNGNSDLYKIMYETAKEDAREYKRKYEEAINDKHKAEIELAGSKGSVIGDLAQGLSGFAPFLMGGSTGAPIASLGEAQQTQQIEKKPVDKRLQSFVMTWSTLDEPTKTSVYKLLVKVFTDVSVIDKMLSI